MQRVEEKIILHLDHTLDEVLGDDMGVTGVRIKTTDTQTPTELDVSIVFIAIGHQPNTQIFEGELKMHNDLY